MDFVVGGTAGAFGTLVTNPIDVVKTRLQLQGELQAGNEKMRYKGVCHGIFLIWKTEGLMALQKGLVPAVWNSIFLNAVRLGMYRMIKDNGWDRNKDGERSFGKTLGWSFLCGGTGAVVSNPAAVVKTRMQSHAHPSIAVGEQHDYSGFWDAMQKILKKEGIAGFYSGVSSFALRIAVGSTAQLSSYTLAKDTLRAHKLLDVNPGLLTLVSSLISGAVVSTVVCPLDVTTIRLYNQAKDNVKYNNLLDCTVKIVRSEGILALWKGYTALYFRLAPHTLISLSLWEFINKIMTR